MTAKEARARTLEAIKRKNLLGIYEKLIKQACDEGQYEVLIMDCTPPQIVKILIERGFTVENNIAWNHSKIKWGEIEK